MKNLILTLTLLLGVMSYGQGNVQQAYITEFTSSSSGEKIFLHRQNASSPSRHCQGGAIPRFEFTTQYYVRSLNIQGDDVLRIDPNITDGDPTNFITYHWVSNNDKDDFRNDITSGRDNTNSSRIHYTRNGGVSLYTPCGTITPREYLESRYNFNRRAGSSTYFFGDATNTYISVISDSSFRVAIGTLPSIVFESYDNVADAYNRLLEVLEFEVWEILLLSELGFEVYDGPLTYEYEKRCSNGRILRARTGHTPNRLVIFNQSTSGSYLLNGDDPTRIRNTVNLECGS